MLRANYQLTIRQTAAAYLTSKSHRTRGTVHGQVYHCDDRLLSTVTFTAKRARFQKKALGICEEEHRLCSTV
jgi:hypothetical protein